MVKKTSTSKKTKPALGAVVMVHTRSSSHWIAMTEPAIQDLEGHSFLVGTQVTGKPGHRMEGKRTLIPLEHVASITEFQTEEDLWSEPQPRHLRAVEENSQNAVLTSHEGGNQPRQQHHGRNRHRGRHHHNNNRFQGEPNFNR